MELFNSIFFNSDFGCTFCSLYDIAGNDVSNVEPATAKIQASFIYKYNQGLVSHNGEWIVYQECQEKQIYYHEMAAFWQISEQRVRTNTYDHPNPESVEQSTHFNDSSWIKSEALRRYNYNLVPDTETA